MANEHIDYLLVNSTNEFLVEYCPLQENARYHLTGFSGSTGDALLSQKELFLFVDGRYHEQADIEVNKDTTVVKLKMGETFISALSKKANKNKTLGIVAKKTSLSRLETIEKTLEEKNILVKLLQSDPVFEFLDKKNETKTKQNIEQIDKKITGKTFEQKFKAISSKLKENEAFLITNLNEISYLFNLRSFPEKFSQNFTSQIEAKSFVAKDFAILFTDGKIKHSEKNYKIKTLKDFNNFIQNINEATTVFVCKTSINAYDYSLLEDRAQFMKENPIKEMKSIKTKEEIAHLKTCFERADKALLATREYILSNSNISEYDIAQFLEKEFYSQGARALSFKPIVARGKNSALAHYSKNSKAEILKDGDLVLIDCGAYFEGGYATDATRVFVKGTPTKIQKEVYTCVLKAFLTAFNKKGVNISGVVLDKTARNILNKISPKGYEFSHSLGHGIGINVHESPPTLSSAASAKGFLQENMCFTIEPGLYKQGAFGVRLENSCYLSKEGIKSFSSMCFEASLIDYTLLTPREKKWLKDFEVK